MSLQWEKHNKQKLAAMRQSSLNEATTRIPVQVDQSFWTAWRDDTVAMKQAGYRVSKVGGRWTAWIER
jgi:hypothetical protein